MYFDTRSEVNTNKHLLGAILLQRLLPKKHVIAGSLQHHVLLFAGKIMAADANQLQDLRKFLRAGDEDSARIKVNRKFKSIVSRE